MKSPLHRLWRQAHALGAGGTFVADVAIYGTRRTPLTNAGDAPARNSASGIGPHSVWQGPRKILGGAPVLRRKKTA